AASPQPTTAKSRPSSVQVVGHPYALTTNNVPDLAPRVAFTADGEPAIAWLSDGQVVGIIGDLTAQPTVWLDAESSPGLALGNAVLVAGGRGELVLAWTGAEHGVPGAWLAREEPASGRWSEPSALFPGQS